MKFWKLLQDLINNYFLHLNLNYESILKVWYTNVSQKIFILFNRLHNKEQYVGTGIGLAICKKIIDNHKGYIFAEGIPNQGAVFTIYLPV